MKEVRERCDVWCNKRRKEGRVISVMEIMMFLLFIYLFLFLFIIFFKCIECNVEKKNK